jgi:small subunit ribosomal protein S5
MSEKERKFERKRDNAQLLNLRFVSTTTAGGRKQRYSVLCASSEEMGNKTFIGVGSARGDSMKKAMDKSSQKSKNKRNMVLLKTYKKSIVHDIFVKQCGMTLHLRRAPEGSGMKGGGILRQMLSAAGIKDITGKCHGRSTSAHNIAYSLIKGLKSLETVREIANRMDTTVEEILKRNF